MDFPRQLEKVGKQSTLIKSMNIFVSLTTIFSIGYITLTVSRTVVTEHFSKEAALEAVINCCASAL